MKKLNNSLTPQPESALHQALDAGVFDTFPSLLNQETIDLNAQTMYGLTPLAKAVIMGETAIVELLIRQKRIQVNRVDSRRYTPLHYAVLCGNIEMVNILLSHPETNLDITNRPFNKNVMELATESGSPEMQELLHQHYAAHSFGDQPNEGDPFEEREWNREIDYPGDQLFNLNIRPQEDLPEILRIKKQVQGE